MQTRAYQLAYLLVGETESALAAVIETARLPNLTETHSWYELAQAALRHAERLSPDRFFLRSLANPEGIMARVYRLPITERTALVLDAMGEFTLDQVASLLRLPSESAQELLARTWRQVGLERVELSAALLASVPPLPAERLQALLAGDESRPVEVDVAPEAERRAPRRRRPWIGLAFAILLIAFFALRWWPRASNSIATDEVVPVISPVATGSTEIPQEQPLPQPRRFDFRSFTPESIQSFMAYGMNAPAHEGAQEIATMVLQWLGEATIVAEAPGASAGDSHLGLSLRSTDGRSFWLQLEDFCWARIESCLVTVGGEGQTPIRLRQEDLTRWMAAGAWTRAFQMPNSMMVYPDQGSRLRTEDEMRSRAERDAPPGWYQITVNRQALLRLTQAEGAWRTVGEPAWVVFLRPLEPGQTKGEMLIYRDSDGALLERREVQFSSP